MRKILTQGGNTIVTQGGYNGEHDAGEGRHTQ